MTFDRFPDNVPVTKEGISIGWIELSQEQIEDLFGFEVDQVLRKGEAWIVTFRREIYEL